MPRWPTITENVTKATKTFFENMWAATEEGDAEVAQTVTDETSARTSADSALEAARVSGDNSVAATVAAEKSAREAAITAEQAARASAVSAEASARVAEIAAEQARAMAAEATKITQSAADGRYGRYPELAEVANITASEFTVSSTATVHVYTLKNNAITIHLPAEVTLGTGHVVYLLQDVSGNRVASFANMKWVERAAPINLSVTPEYLDVATFLPHPDLTHWMGFVIGVNIG